MIDSIVSVSYTHLDVYKGQEQNKELHLMPYAEAITNTRQWLVITGKVDSTNILKREVVNDSLMMKMGQSPAKKNHPNVVVILIDVYKRQI